MILSEYNEKEVHQIWLEDAASLQAKLQMLRAYEIAGVSFWKLGMESGDVWELIADYTAG